VTNINPTTIINNYQAAPVVNNTVVKNYTTNNQRYNYTNGAVKEKPHNTVINRIQQNQTIIDEGRKEKASMVQQRVKSIPEGKINREVRIEAPKVTNNIVPAGEVNRPKTEIKLQQKVIKSPGGAGKSEEQPVQPAARLERASPAKPAQPEQPAVRPERVVPERPSQQEQPRQPARPERVSPAKPAQPEQPAARPERAAPAKPRETINPPGREAVEKPREQIPVQKQIEKPKKPIPSEKDEEKQIKRKPPEKEEEKPKG
jgi:hypothetical protein